MSKQFNIDNKEYLSSIAAAKAVGYSRDNISRLCRSGNLECRRIGLTWFIEKSSLQLFVQQGAEKINVQKDLQVHNSDFYENTENLERRAALNSDFHTDKEMEDASRQEKQRPTTVSSIRAEFKTMKVGKPIASLPQAVLKQPILSTKSASEQSKYFRDTKIAKKKKRFGPIIGTFAVVLVTTGSYWVAQSYVTPLHVYIQNTAQDAREGFSYLLDN